MNRSDEVACNHQWFAERAHPTDEYLLPLFVALGAAGADAQAQRIDAGIDMGFLAMDIYRFD